MPKPPTARLGIPRYEDTETAQFSEQVNAISDAIDADACIFNKGKLSARPAAGIVGRYYLAEDGTKSGCAWGDLYLDTGTEWVGPVNAPTHAPLGTLMDSALPGDPVDPDGVTRWLVADGRAISRVTYAAFFAKVQADGLLATWGEGNGTTTFNIPNLTGRVAVQPGGSGVTALGSKGGEQTHALVPHELPGYISTAAGVMVIPESGSGILVSGAGGGSGAGDPHNNMPPYVGLYKLIRVL